MFYIFSTGTELSSGRSRDTNGPYLAASLSDAGLDVGGIITLPDDPKSLQSELERFLAMPDTRGIIMTGGLGPTEDDHTVDVLCRMTGKSAVEDEYALRRLEAAARRIPGRLQLASARRQTRVLEGCRVLKNERGLAPGMIVEFPPHANAGPDADTTNRFIAVMPGVPSEMRGMFEGTLFPYILERYAAHDRKRLVFFVYGQGESQVQAKIFGDTRTERAIPAELPDDFRWGITAQPGFVKLFFETRDSGFLTTIDDACARLFSESKLSLPVEELLHEHCLKNKQTLSLAESCTGGWISKILTDRPGSSGYFLGAAVVYANSAKEKLLNVRAETLTEKGAVSEECALEMAAGARSLYGSDFAFSITGIAGPDGGTEAKPVGTIHMAATDGNRTESFRLLLPFERERVREYASRMALYHLYTFIVRT